MKWLDNNREDCEDLNMSIVQASCLTWDAVNAETLFSSQFGLPEHEDYVTVSTAIHQVTISVCVQQFL